MDNSNRPNNRNLDYLGVNKLGKNIKKSPIHQPNFNNANSANRQQPQPQVYNINKNDFRSIVQQLTGSPSQEPQPRPPPHNPPKPPSMRLQKIRPPPLAPINRPQIPMHPPAPMPAPGQPAGGVAYNNNFARPPPPQYGQPSPPMMPPFNPGDVWANTAESPISAYMRYLQHSIIEPGPKQTQTHPPSSGLLPNPSMPPLPSPRMNGPPPLLPSPRMNGPPPLLPSPRTNGPPPLPSPRMNGPHPPFPSPRMNGPPPPLPSPSFFPSPTSQFLLQSPTGFFNMLSPRSPYPLLSPGAQHPPPFSPNFSFSHMAQPGILGPGPQFPPSPGYFPLSPSGFFPMTSPRWRDQ
ncbi:protein HAIKU1-like [Lycium ferocissimum]|uniref:protein HAIKU1-like n=1 Tax=Lycium ferocissimum TaxID=112874 RepID=UPI002816618C|nr:protein HAIKU1-like [Lycium ferocissimum]